MNLSEIRVPSLAQLQLLFPLGIIDLDVEAQREIRSVFAFRNTFVRMTDPAAIGKTRDALDEIMENLGKEERARLGFAEDDMSEESRRLSLNALKVYGAQFLGIAAEMQAQDSTSPGLNLARVDNQGTMEIEAGEISRQRAFPASGRLGTALAAVMGSYPIPLPVIQCVVHAVLHGMFRDVVYAGMYRRHPGIRFPVQRLVVVNVEVPDEATSLEATVTGYQIPLLSSMQPRAIPDIIDSSMFEKRDPK